MSINPRFLQGCGGIDLGPVVAIYAQGVRATEERRQRAELQVKVLPGPPFKRGRNENARRTKKDVVYGVKRRVAKSR